MHASRVCTARFGPCLGLGECASGPGSEGCAPSPYHPLPHTPLCPSADWDTHTPAQVHAGIPPVGQTRSCENITSQQLRLRAVIRDTQGCIVVRVLQSTVHVF